MVATPGEKEVKKERINIMITNLVLLAGFWAAVGNFFKWLLVGIGCIMLISCFYCLTKMIIHVIKANKKLEPK